MASGVVNSQSYEERTLIGSPIGVIFGLKGSSASGFEDATGSKSTQSSRSKATTASSSNFQGATTSGDADYQASSNEDTGSEFAPTPRTDDPTLVADEPNRWCVEGQ